MNVLSFMNLGEKHTIHKSFKPASATCDYSNTVQRRCSGWISTPSVGDDVGEKSVAHFTNREKEHDRSCCVSGVYQGL
jgi:hypothetical protein